VRKLTDILSNSANSAGLQGKTCGARTTARIPEIKRNVEERSRRAINNLDLKVQSLSQHAAPIPLSSYLRASEDRGRKTLIRTDDLVSSPTTRLSHTRQLYQ